MILGGGPITMQQLRADPVDVFIYGLGFETRSIAAAKRQPVATKICAIQMPEVRVHSYSRNVAFARANNHAIFDKVGEMFSSAICPIIGEYDDRPLSIRFDVSSVNRIVMYQILIGLSVNLREFDTVEIIYCPAAFSEPDWQFPQIESIGPAVGEMTAFNSDPRKPLCLLLGLGFDPGISMGIISQLEPRLSFCLWGSGVDARFDAAVRRANFDFDYPGFTVKTIPYLIKDPLSTYSYVENIVFGLKTDFNIVMVPMGPKIFALLSGLVALAHCGEMAIWRVSHRREHPADARPSSLAVSATIDVARLISCGSSLSKDLPELNPRESA